MAIHVSIYHQTCYVYDRAIQLSPQIVRLRPAAHSRTPILSYSLHISPKNHFINWQQDPQGNYLARVVFPEKITEFKVEVNVVADMTVINPFDFFLESYAEKASFTYEPALLKELKPFLEVREEEKNLLAYVKNFRRSERQNTTDFLVELNQKLQSDIGYLIRMEPGIQSCEETLEKKSGSCRDSAWLLVQILRHLGLAARFVSGYLVQLVPDVKSLDGPSGPNQDFTDLHAWAEVYLPGAGWVGLDPTSGLLAGEGHIPLACTPEASSAAPITGNVEKCEVDFSFSMSVTRIHEDSRVTKPYTEKQWRKIDALGEEVDKYLLENDIRLTMGGEPTFVSIDDMEGEEWNTSAVGPMKRTLAEDLLQRLKKRWAQHGFIHYGQGKWYPGESLPRWALGCYWHKDKKPLWKNPQLLADEKTAYSFTEKDALRFITALVKGLNVNENDIIPAYEDVFYYLWKERTLPINVDPFNSRLKDPEERARLIKIFTRLDAVVGYALPLTKTEKWQSGPWYFRDRMFLIPGDSPMGLRLPLDSLPWVDPKHYPHVKVKDPLKHLEPKDEEKQKKVESEKKVDVPRQKTAPEEAEMYSIEKGKSASWVIRTSLCTEVRNGKMHVFMPPLATAKDYFELIAAVEKVADSLQIPIVVEGYTPPYDPDICSFKVTPDPGVVEVNVHPSSTWRELVENTTSLYEEAHQARLGTEKFMLDGKHMGTGGGNHLVIGGTTPADSPILRRPNLLSSLVSYWHNHPSLSYLFSGLFFGPMSQAPRVDEGRRDSVYELEIAMQQIAEQQDIPPSLVDRIFRHLLVDITGNTHRAEFCIDKLCSPDGPSGRLGLVEFRAFEMPPHAQMSLVQQLLLRSLIAKFWQEPYTQKLIRWETTLHDRFMLPHFVFQDFEDVVLELQKANYAFATEYFAPHFEFRFPVYGSVVQRGIKLELRQALEPWYVLGEETTQSRTSRYVDSSVERLQVKVEGLIDPRYIVTCNGQYIPLYPTGTRGVFVAGVRYRAWQPYSCLHPTIPVHTPLVFDIVDTWNMCSLGGCTYHVAHPGGRNFEKFPVNALEAESRRTQRFFAMGHTPSTLKELPTKIIHPDFPFTLDLRYSQQ